MYSCLGIFADAVVTAAHRHEFSWHCNQKNYWLMPPKEILPSVTPSRWINDRTRPTPSRTCSVASNGPANNPEFVVLEDPALLLEEYDGSSRASSFTGSAPLGQRSRKSSAASKTSFQLAHPPPAIKHRQRFNIRPKVLLQLQQISDASRPVPILDVLPSVVFAPKLARKFPSVFKGKDGLGADDLVVVTSQNYDSSGALNDKSEIILEDESWASREIVAAICQPRKRGGAEGVTEICLNHGPLWEASCLPSGAYEFASVDGNGQRTVVRWVPKLSVNRRRSYNSQSNQVPASTEQRKFTFSIINPNSRRHPIIATLSRFSIDVSDRYSTPSSAIPTYDPRLGQQLTVPDGRHAHFNESERPAKSMAETDERLRSLIVVTGIWVAFQEGYSPNYQYAKPAASPPISTQPATPAKRRNLSISLGSLGSSRTVTAESPHQANGLLTAPGGDMSPSSLNPASPPITPIRSPPPPHRTRSTGTAFLQRANSRRPHPSGESSQPSPVLASNGGDSEFGSFGRRTSRAIFKKENSPPEKEPPARFPFESVDSESLNRMATIDSGKLPGVTAVPIARATRKPSRLNKLFGFLRRTSGAK